jgi:hypothetical protein
MISKRIQGRSRGGSGQDPGQTIRTECTDLQDGDHRPDLIPCRLVEEGLMWVGWMSAFYRSEVRDRRRWVTHFKVRPCDDPTHDACRIFDVGNVQITNGMRRGRGITLIVPELWSVEGSMSIGLSLGKGFGPSNGLTRNTPKLAKHEMVYSRGFPTRNLFLTAFRLAGL